MPTSASSSFRSPIRWNRCRESCGRRLPNSDRWDRSREAAPGSVQLRLLFDQDQDDTGIHDAERTRRAGRDIDDPAAHKRPAIVDPALDRMAVIGNPDHAAERTATMRAGHFITLADTAIIRG